MAEFLHETLLQFVLLYEADDVAHHRAEGLLLYTHLGRGGAGCRVQGKLFILYL